MTRQLDEESVFSEFQGKAVELEALTRLGYVDSSADSARLGNTSYVITLNNDLDEPVCPPEFGVTSRLNESWWSRAVEFCVCLDIKDGVIIDGYIHKYRHRMGGICFMPGGYYLVPSQQECRVTRRVLAYLTGA